MVVYNHSKLDKVGINRLGSLFILILILEGVPAELHCRYSLQYKMRGYYANRAM